MGLLKKIARYLTYIVIINIMVMFIAVLSLNSLFYPETYIKSFEKNDIYSMMDNSLFNGSIKEMIILPEGGTKQLIDEKITNIFSYARSKTDTLDLSLKTKEDFSYISLEKNLGTLPICPGGINFIQNNQIVCRPSNMTTKDFTNYLIDNNYIQKPEKTNQTLDLKEAIDKDNGLTKLRKFYSTYKIIKYIIFALLLLFVFLLLFLYVDSIKGFVRAIEIILVVYGIIGIKVSFTIASVSSGQINTLAAGDAGLGPMFKALAGDIIHGFTNRILIISIIILIIGIISLTVSWVYDRGHGEEKKK